MKFKSFLFAMLAIVVSFASSCKKDRPEPQPDPVDPKTAMLSVRVWTPVSATQMSGSTRVPYTLTSDELKDKWTFKADGSLSVVAFNSSGDSFAGTWAWNTDKTIATLTFKYTGSTTTQTLPLTIITLTSTVLVFELPNKRQLTLN